MFFIIPILSVQSEFHQAVYTDACDAEYECFEECIETTEVDKYDVDHVAACGKLIYIFYMELTDAVEQPVRIGGKPDDDDDERHPEGYEEVRQLEPHTLLVSAVLRQMIEADQEECSRHRFDGKLCQGKVGCPEEYEEQRHGEADGAEHDDRNHARLRAEDDGNRHQYDEYDGHFVYADRRHIIKADPYPCIQQREDAHHDEEQKYIYEIGADEAAHVRIGYFP